MQIGIKASGYLIIPVVYSSIFLIIFLFWVSNLLNWNQTQPMVWSMIFCQILRIEWSCLTLFPWFIVQVLPPLCAELRNLVMQPMILPMVLTIAEAQVLIPSVLVDIRIWISVLQFNACILFINIIIDVKAKILDIKFLMMS